jgi:hypothetical protein
MFRGFAGMVGWRNDREIGLKRFPPMRLDFLEIHRIIFLKRIDTANPLRA